MPDRHVGAPQGPFFLSAWLVVQSRGGNTPETGVGYALRQEP